MRTRSLPDAFTHFISQTEGCVSRGDGSHLNSDTDDRLLPELTASIARQPLLLHLPQLQTLCVCAFKGLWIWLGGKGQAWGVEGQKGGEGFVEGEG